MKKPGCICLASVILLSVLLISGCASVSGTFNYDPLDQQICFFRGYDSDGNLVSEGQGLFFTPQGDFLVPQTAVRGTAYLEFLSPLNIRLTPESVTYENSDHTIMMLRFTEDEKIKRLFPHAEPPVMTEETLPERIDIYHIFNNMAIRQTRLDFYFPPQDPNEDRNYEMNLSFRGRGFFHGKNLNSLNTAYMKTYLPSGSISSYDELNPYDLAVPEDIFLLACPVFLNGTISCTADSILGMSVTGTFNGVPQYTNVPLKDIASPTESVSFQIWSDSGNNSRPDPIGYYPVFYTAIVSAEDTDNTGQLYYAAKAEELTPLIERFSGGSEPEGPAGKFVRYCMDKLVTGKLKTAFEQNEKAAKWSEILGSPVLVTQVGFLEDISSFDWELIYADDIQYRVRYEAAEIPAAETEARTWKAVLEEALVIIHSANSSGDDYKKIIRELGRKFLDDGFYLQAYNSYMMMPDYSWLKDDIALTADKAEAGYFSGKKDYAFDLIEAEIQEKYWDAPGVLESFPFLSDSERNVFIAEYKKFQSTVTDEEKLLTGFYHEYPDWGAEGFDNWIILMENNTFYRGYDYPFPNYRTKPAGTWKIVNGFLHLSTGEDYIIEYINIGEEVYRTVIRNSNWDYYYLLNGAVYSFFPD